MDTEQEAKETMVSSDEMEPTVTGQPIEATEGNEIPFESLHQGSIVLRFEENARTVSVTWLPDDPAATPIREHYPLSDDEFDGECFTRCFRQCRAGGGSVLTCVLLCLAQCRGGD